jgi:TonB-linked SusC/RagA family outer membrane protein
MNLKLRMGWIHPKILLVMKLTTLLIVIALMQASAKSFSQQITLNVTNAPLKQVLQSIEQQSGYVFFYDSKLADQNVTVTVTNANIQKTLIETFKNVPITYKIADKNIILQAERTDLVKKFKSELAIPVSVQGKVQDATGQPLQNVNVREKGTTNGTVTDEKGNFKFSVAGDNSSIVFSFIGYETQELAAKDIPSGSTIVLKPTSTNLKEVVVNKGYYSTTEELNTGDVTTITSKDIEKQPVDNVLQAMEGRVPGMFIQQQTGLPGGGFNVQLRGQNSIANGNNPLYIVDGVPLAATPQQGNGSNSNGPLHDGGYAIESGNILNYINPSEIESVTVLKDGDATAIYGSRGANGVILITTKKGVAGATSLTGSYTQGVGEQADPTKWLNTSQYLTIRHQAYANDGTQTIPSTDYDLNGTWDTTRNTNWEKMLADNHTQYTDANLTLSGGNGDVQYLLGGNFHHETTILPGDFGDQKVSFHSSITGSSQNKKFKFTFSGSYLADNDKLSVFDPSGVINQYAPDAPPVYNSNGTLNWANSTWTNPYALLLQPYTAATKNLIANGNFSYEIIPGLTLSSSIGYNITNNYEYNAQPLASQDPATASTNQGSAAWINSTYTAWNIEPQLNYIKKINKGTLTALIGSTFSDSQNSANAIFGSGYNNDVLLNTINGASSSFNQDLPSTDYRYSSVFSRIGFNWDDKYVLNITGRRDGSSRFGPGKEFGNFGALGGAWIFSKEKGVEDILPFLSFGKIRSSYGITGNDQIGDYQYYDLYNLTGGSATSYLQSISLYPYSIFNPNYSWEVNRKFELAIDLGFLNNRINFSVNYFRNVSSNQLLPYPLASITGEGAVLENTPAKVSNTGTELVLNTINVKSGNFRWSTDFNISFNRNKLLSYPGLAESSYASSLVVGEPLNIRLAYQAEGVNPLTGLYQFKNAEGNIVNNPLTNADRTAIVNLNPSFFGGIGNNFSYKGLTLSIFINYVHELAPDPILSGIQFIIPGMPETNIPAAILGNYWQKPGDITRYEKATASFSSAATTALFNAEQSTLAYTDGSFLRVSNINLAYDLPSTWLSHLHIKAIKVFIQGQNVFTFTKYALDPESRSTASTSPLRVITSGIKFNL